MRYIVLAVLAFLFCSNPPTASSPSVIGTWVGSITNDLPYDLDNDGTADTSIEVIATMTLIISDPNSYTITNKLTVPALNLQGVTSHESGSWKIESNYFITTPLSCSEADEPGSSLKVIVCGEGSSIAVNVQGDTWNVNQDVSGQIITIPMKRI